MNYGVAREGAVVESKVGRKPRCAPALPRKLLGQRISDKKQESP
jgi:hypothetical protein